MANLTFTTGSEAATIKLKTVGSPLPNSFNQNINEAITIPANSSITFVGSNTYLSRDGSNYYQFETSGGDLTVSCDLVSLVNNSQVKMYGFVNLFKGCINIKDISNLVFPASIADWCYSNMFAHCTGLVNAGTTLPATSLGRWCYNGMFAGCTSLTTPPTINATTIAPFGFYSMFYGCSSLKDAPAILAKTMNGEFTCNGMFRNCSSLSSVTVSITNWSTAQNENKNWLYDVAQSGVFNYPNTLASIPSGVKPEGWTEVATYPSIINVEDQSFSFDAMSDTSQTKEFNYSYNGEETVSIQVDTTNKPSWLSYTTDNNSVNFVANGYSIDSNTSFELPITLSATDAATKHATATFNITNYPTYTITFDTISAISWDFEEATTSSVNLLQYIHYSGSSLSTEVTGLPEGVVYEGGVLSANKELMEGNVDTTFDLIASASDARTATASNIDLDITGLTNPYQLMPFTIKNIDYDAGMQRYVKFSNNNASNIKYYHRNADGTLKTSGYCGINIYMNAGEYVEFEGTSGYTNGKIASFESREDGKYQFYGNIASLVGWSDTIENYNFQSMFYNMKQIKDVSNLVIGPRTVKYQGCRDMFNYCSFTTPPIVKSSNLAGTEACAFMLANNSSLTAACHFPVTGNVASRALASVHDFDTGIVQANFRLPSGCTLQGGVYQGYLWACTGLKRSPIFGNSILSTGSSSNGNYYNFCNNQNNSTGLAISAIEVEFTSWGNNPYDTQATNNTYRWFMGAGSTGIFIKPPSLPMIGGNSNYGYPAGWTVLNRHEDNSLWYVNSSNQETGEYTGVDPYADMH